MTKEEILAEITQLPIDERKEIFEILGRDIRNASNRPARKGSPVERVSGLLKTDNLAPTDEEMKHDYIDYLDSKYS